MLLLLHSTILILLLFSQRSLSVPFNYTGPTQCANTDSDDDKTTIGYSDLVILNQDMYVEAYEVVVENKTAKSSYTYVVCPGTTFDFNQLYNETAAEQYIVPYLSNVTLVCGDGDGDDDCIFFGGNGYHIYFVPQFITFNVKIVGFTFTNNLYTSVAAFGHPLSYALFDNCTWVDNNFDMFAVDMYFDPSNGWGRKRHRNRRDLEEDELLLLMEETSSASPQQHYYEDLLPYISDYYDNLYNNHDDLKQRRTLGYPSMLLWFNQSYFLDNYATSIINNEGGILDLQRTTFADNRVFLAIVDVLFGGHLIMRNDTHFESNTITFVPVFLDSTSMLQYNKDVTGLDQVSLGPEGDGEGQNCVNGIFLEDKNSYCLHGGKCLGDCCDFGDETCDEFVPRDSTATQMDPPAPSGDISNDPHLPNSAGTTTTKVTDHGDVNFQAPASFTVANSSSTKQMSSSAFNGVIAIVVVLGIGVIAFAGLFIRRWQRKRRDLQLGNQPAHEIA